MPRRLRRRSRRECYRLSLVSWYRTLTAFALGGHSVAMVWCAFSALGFRLFPDVAEESTIPAVPTIASTHLLDLNPTLALDAPHQGPTQGQLTGQPTDPHADHLLDLHQGQPQGHALDLLQADLIHLKGQWSNTSEMVSPRDKEFLPAPDAMLIDCLFSKDGHPSSAFPLQECQGDCDTNQDVSASPLLMAHTRYIMISQPFSFLIQCAHGLVCFQRGSYQAVPGCRGGEHDSSHNDYCIRGPSAPHPSTKQPTPRPHPSPTPRPPHPSPTPVIKVVGNGTL